MVLPFVAIVVATPSVAVVFREVGSHVPERGLVVVQVVVEVKHPGVDGAVGLNDGNVRQLDVGWDLAFPDGFDHAVLDQHVTLVDDVGFAGHGDDAPFQNVGAFVHVIVQAVAANHVLSDRITRIVAPAGRGGLDFRDGSVEGFDVGRVPPRVFSPVRQRVDHVAGGVGDGGGVAVPIIQLNSGTGSEDDDVVVWRNGRVPCQSARRGAAFSHVIQEPVRDINWVGACIP